MRKTSLRRSILARLAGLVLLGVIGVVAALTAVQLLAPVAPLSAGWFLALAQISLGSACVAVACGARYIVQPLEERAQAMDDMAASLARLTRQNRLLLECAGEGVLGLDLTGRVLFANPAAARLTGYAAEELVGRPLHDLFHPPQPGVSPHTCETCPLLAARDGSVHRVTADFFLRKDGTRFPVDGTSSPIRESGEIIGLGLMFADVSERRGLEEQFRQSQKMEAIGRLAGGLAHDFNNIITVISGFAGILRDRVPVAAQEEVDEILRAAGQAATLTRQLLVFSRQEPSSPQLMDLNATVSQMERMLRRVLGEDVQLATALAPTLGLVRMDAGQIEQVLMNLAVNARDAMPRGGRLTLETGDVELHEEMPFGPLGARSGAYVVIAVTDTGCGMDESTRARIFEPFFSTKEHHRGTGLGLSIVYGVVKQSGGEIYVHSSPGQGTTFKIYLPRAEGQLKSAPVEHQAPPGTETVLLVEDDASTAKVIRRVLQARGYEVLEARGGEEALELLDARGAVDLLITDLVLPGMSGSDLAGLVAVKRPQLKVLFISGYTDRAVMERIGLGPGAAYLQKPFTPVALASAVRAILDGGHAPPSLPAPPCGTLSAPC